MRELFSQQSHWVLLGALCCCVITVFLWWEQSKVNDAELRVCFLDVQGDAALITTQENHHILVDGGNDPQVLGQIGKYLPFWQRKIDTILMTHLDHDHAYGLTQVLKYYDVQNLIWGGNVRDHHLLPVLIQQIAQQNITAHTTFADQNYQLDNALFSFLWPADSQLGVTTNDPNNQSLVFHLTSPHHPQSGVLFAGDIEQKTEQKLLTSPMNLQASILKVPHHGSKTSSSDDFLSAVAPQLSIVPAAADNRFGHPHQEVVDRLKQASQQVLITGQQGNICIAMQNGQWQLL